MINIKGTLYRFKIDANSKIISNKLSTKNNLHILTKNRTLRDPLSIT